MKPEIVWLHVLLSRWGRWSIRKASGGLGYAKMSIIAGAHEGDGSYDPAPPPDVTDADYESVSVAVAALPKEQTIAVMQLYVQGSGKAFYRVARDAGIHRDTLQRLILSAHRSLESMLTRETRK